MDVTIVGAGGDCGRQMAVQIISQRLLSRYDRLQLVGRAGGPSAKSLLGLRTDLFDAFAENCPEVDVALNPEEVVGDIIIMTGGRTIPPDFSTEKMDRNTLAATNKPIFEAYAKAIKENGSGEEVVIVVTNPVELGVAVFSQYLGRRRVIGIGAYQDSLRFRREIALELGVRRQMVQGYVLGQHGDHMAPLWSTVRVKGFTDRERLNMIDNLSQGVSINDYHQQLFKHRNDLTTLLKNGEFPAAFNLVNDLSPSLRTALLPYLTHMSGSKTAIATANVTVDLIKTLMDGRDVLVAGQVLLDGEFYNMHSVVGAPIIVGPSGWQRVVPIQLAEDEVRVLTECALTIDDHLKKWMNT